MNRRRVTLHVACGLGALLLLGTGDAEAFQPVPETGLEVHLELLESVLVAPRLTTEPTSFHAAMSSAGIDGWRVRWNQLTGTPHRVIGPGLQLITGPGLHRDSGGFEDHARVDQASRAFVAAQPELFGVRSTDLVTLHQAHAGRHWSVIYQQTHHGIPVEGGRLDFLYFDDGRLVLFGSDAHRDIQLDTTPALSAVDAASAAVRGMPAASLEADRAPELRILPIPTELADEDVPVVVHRLAYRVFVTTAEPVGRWVTWVDAHSGQVLWRWNAIRHFEITGNVSGDVEDPDYCAGSDNQTFQNLIVTVIGVGSDTTDASGNYAITVPDESERNLHASNLGAHVNVNNSGGPEAVVVEPVTPGTPFDIIWDDSNSQADERDVYVHTDRVYRFIRSFDPTTPLGVLDTSVVARVSINDTCNAFWDGVAMNFYREGDGCANYGRIGDIVYHEWGHGLTDFVYDVDPSSDLHEGNSDIIATHMTERSWIGNGSTLGACGSGLRDCDNSLRYPEDVVGQQAHSAGRVICGFDWDVRKGLEISNPPIFQSHSDSLWHFGRVMLQPQTQPDQSEIYFFLDDDDGDITNGSPHYEVICQAAVNHGFETPGPASLNPVSLTHSALHSTTSTTGGYEVVANISSTAGAIDAAATRLVYRLDGGASQEVPMAATGGPNEYAGSIPAQPVGTRINYAIVTADVLGNPGVYPPSPCAPDEIAGEEVFHVATEIDELEVASGWSVGAPDDDATSGIWERVDPNRTASQTGDDRTPEPGMMCFVTGQGSPGGGVGENDVDGGKTTLFSPLYDLTGVGVAEVLYHRWYSNNVGNSPNQDLWIVDASNDGGFSWISIESTDVSEHAWKEIRFSVNDVFGEAPNQLQLRFAASDTEGGSLVEAGIDELMIFADPTSTAINSAGLAQPSVRFALESAVPNPFNPSTSIGFALPARAPVTLTVFDINGRMVRQLARALPFEAGQHAVTWDGRNEHGSLTASGIYYVRMSTPGFQATNKLVMLK